MPVGGSARPAGKQIRAGRSLGVHHLVVSLCSECGLTSYLMVPRSSACKKVSPSLPTPAGGNALEVDLKAGLENIKAVIKCIVVDLGVNVVDHDAHIGIKIPVQAYREVVLLAAEHKPVIEVQV